MKAITLYDVALLAGVSYQTVSRVINDAEHVSARTREKVQQAMAELHYVPNLRAQQLAGKRTRTLGLITTDLALHAPSQIVSAVKSRAAEQGASVLISMVEQPQQCQAALQALLAQRVDALLVNVPLDDEHAEQLRALASPVPVLFLDVSSSAQVNSLVFNAVQGAHLGVEHLLSLGHQRIALLGESNNQAFITQRRQGYLDALREAGLSSEWLRAMPPSRRVGYATTKELLSLSQPPTAIITDCNTHGDGAAMALAELGRLTGENAVALVVYDGLPQDSIVDADVAAVIQSTRQGVGKQIADMVRQLINGEAIEQLQVLWQPEFSPGQTA